MPAAGGNLFFTLNVPSSSGLGSPLDVSSLGPSKSFYLSGSFNGSYVILASTDGTNYLPITSFQGGSGPQTVQVDVQGTYRFIIVSRQADQSVSITMASQAIYTPNGTVATNVFLPLPAINPGASGPQAPIDLLALASPLGLTDNLTFVCPGSFSGTIAIEGSTDGVHYGTLAQFTVGDSGISSQVSQQSPIYIEQLATRYIRANVLGAITSTVSIEVSGEVAVNPAAGSGPQGAQGPTGAQGFQGAQGPIAFGTPGIIGGIGSNSPTVGTAPTTLHSDSLPGQKLVAQWDPNVWAVCAIDYDAGNDNNQGLTIATSSSFADFQTADIAAGAVALKTMQQAGNVIPPEGAGRLLAIIICSRAGGNSYLKQDGVTVDTLDSFMSKLHGYQKIIIWGTGTNSTAGATKFTGTLQDFTFAGAIPVPGTNTQGYNPNTGATSTTVPCLQVGGAAPALAAEPAAPLGWSTRYDVATATVALRNVCAATAIVSTTNTVNDTVSPQSAWPATPATTDLFYLEQAGVVCGGWGNAWDTSCQVLICGIRSTGLVNYSPGMVVIGKLLHMFCGSGAGGTVLGTGNTGFSTNQTITPGTGVAAITRGCGFHAVGSVLIQPAATYTQWNGMSVIEGNLNFEFSPGSAIAVGTTIGGGLLFDGGNGSLAINNPNIGNPTVGSALQCRIIGAGSSSAGLILLGSRTNVKDVQITNMGAKPAIQLKGQCELYIQSTNGSTGNTDVGLDLTLSQGSMIVISPGNAPSVTGTVGDIRLADGTIVSWTAMTAFPFTDSAGNKFVGAISSQKNVLCYETAEIDLTTTSSGNPFIPAIPGFFFVTIRIDTINSTLAGTISTAPTTSAGNDGSHINILASASAPTTATFTEGLRGTAPAAGSGASVVAVDLATPITQSVTVAATGTGGFAWKIKYLISGFLIPSF